jgi:hypothetical protein
MLEISEEKIATPQIGRDSTDAINKLNQNISAGIDEIFSRM